MSFRQLINPGCKQIARDYIVCSLLL